MIMLRNYRLIPAVLFLLLTASSIYAADPPPWISGRPVSPSILYQYRIEQRPDFHQQIHRVRVDLRSPDVDLKLVPAEGFPHKTEYPGDIRQKHNALVAVPALLHHNPREGRAYLTGGVRFYDRFYKSDGRFPQVHLRPLNRVELLSPSVCKETKAALLPEDGYEIGDIPINTIPGENGLFLFNRSFSPVKKDEMNEWNIRTCFLLEKLTSEEKPNMYRVRKIYEDHRDIVIPEDHLLVLAAGESGREFQKILPWKKRVRVRFSGGYPGRRILSSFCGGPWFLKKAKYDEEAVEDFCRLPGTPSLYHYSSQDARLALALDRSGNVLSIFAVDRKGFSREGMTLENFANYLAGEGIYDAVALPDGDDAVLMLPDGRVNATAAGVEQPAAACLCISESPSPTGKAVNLLRKFPAMITASGAEPGNPPEAIKDGSYGETSLYNNYWEHTGDNDSDAKGFSIDLQRPYPVKALEFFFAEEAGFSPHFNWREFTVYYHRGNENRIKKFVVKNPEGLPSKYIPLPMQEKVRHIRVVVNEPSSFEQSDSVRLAEMAVWGVLEDRD